MFDRIRRAGPVDASAEVRPVAGGKTIKKILSRFASYLQQRTATLTAKKFRLILVLFCLSWCSLSLCFILGTFTSKNETFITIQRIQVPKYYYRTGEEGLKTKSSIIRNDLVLHKFTDSMNKLKGSPAGRRIYDSLLSARPHLMDSIRQLNWLQTNQK